MTINPPQTPPFFKFQNSNFKNIALLLCGVVLGLCGRTVVKKVRSTIQKMTTQQAPQTLTYLTELQRKQMFTHPNHTLNLYQTMKDIHELFVKHKIPYLMEAGTLLGAVRHKGVIPWDDDGDLGISEEFEKQFKSLEPTLKALGYSIKKMAYGYKVINNKLSFINSKGQEVYAACDVYIRILDAKGNYVYRDKRSRETLNEYWTSKEFPTKRLYQFGKFKLFGPENPDPYLDRAFPGWRDKASYYTVHTGEPFWKIDFKLAPQDLAPAQPLSPLEDRVK